MDLLTRCKPDEFRDFFTNTIIPFAYRGLGSVDSLLNLKLYELDAIKSVINEPELEKLFSMIHGLPFED